MSVPNPSTTDWVALWDLNGGVKLDYKGSWAAGSYVDGDVVVHQGITYMCVRPTSAAPVPWPLASGSASYGTSPPANPVDGQIWIFPAADGVLWQFRYAASAGTYKWEFIGGPPVRSEFPASQTITAINSMQDPATPGPMITVPRAGDYMAQGGAMMNHSTAADAMYVNLCNGATAGFGVYTGAATYAANANVSLIATGRGNGLAAGSDIRVRYQHSVAGTCNVSQRWIEILPVRVS